MFIFRIVCDKSKCTPVSAQLHLVFNLCSACPAFSSHKALAQHCRIKHRALNAMGFYAHQDGICRACGSSFSNRSRLFAHLTDRRRQACRDILLASPAYRLSGEEVAALMEIDREKASISKKLGHSHILSSGPAKRADGRKMGRSV